MMATVLLVFNNHRFTPDPVLLAVSHAQVIWAPAHFTALCAFRLCLEGLTQLLGRILKGELNAYNEN
jgi:hypothetical protein